MDIYWILLAVTEVIAVIILIVVLASNAELFGLFQPGERRAGKRGEKMASKVIRRALHSGDRMLTNVCVEYDGKPAELDNVIINRYGVFIIEVKNYKGRLEGGEDDYEWHKYKITHAGNEYEKPVKNPIKQVKRQTYVLAHYLEVNGARVWIRGYAMLLEGNSPVESEYVLKNTADVERAIHMKARETLDEETVERIELLLK